MPTSSYYRVFVRSLVLAIALVLARAGSVLAQELQRSEITPAPESLRAADTVEVATVELPAAPMPAITAPMPAANSAYAPAAFVPVTAQPNVPARHRFWDRENSVLFVAVGALATVDFCTTRANLASGGRELNPVARVFASSTPLLATNFALETTGNIGLSYLFHKTGHHKLERITSFANISGSAAAVTYGLTHR